MGRDPKVQKLLDELEVELGVMQISLQYKLQQIAMEIKHEMNVNLKEIHNG